MLLHVSYVKGYGWHCGRLLWWLGLMAVGIPLVVGGVILEEVVRVATRGVPIPLALGAPVLFVFLLRKRLKRKLNGTPFAINLPEFFMDDMECLLISRGHRHFRALVMIEVFIWGSVIATQLSIIAAYYVHSVPFLRRLIF